MGDKALCGCIEDPRNFRQEFTIGSDCYKFKKIVWNIIILIFL